LASKKAKMDNYQEAVSENLANSVDEDFQNDRKVLDQLPKSNTAEFLNGSLLQSKNHRQMFDRIDHLNTECKKNGYQSHPQVQNRESICEFYRESHRKSHELICQGGRITKKQLLDSIGGQLELSSRLLSFCHSNNSPVEYLAQNMKSKPANLSSDKTADNQSKTVEILTDKSRKKIEGHELRNQVGESLNTARSLGPPLLRVPIFTYPELNRQMLSSHPLEFNTSMLNYSSNPLFNPRPNQHDFTPCEHHLNSFIIQHPFYSHHQFVAPNPYFQYPSKHQHLALNGPMNMSTINSNISYMNHSMPESKRPF
jgi:hypothetical protein